MNDFPWMTRTMSKTERKEGLKERGNKIAEEREEKACATDFLFLSCLRYLLNTLPHLSRLSD